MFLEDGVEIYDERDIPIDSEVYISTGENYKDPYASTKRKIFLIVFTADLLFIVGYRFP